MHSKKNSRRKNYPHVKTGILITDKPGGFSSRAWDDYIQKKLRIRKGGHVGTLDPIATGLQIVLLGKATKLSNYILETEKNYEATIKLGQRTTTWDSEGEVIADNPVNVKEEDIKEIIEELQGDIQQQVPLYSAVKVDGKPLYYWTRRGIPKEAPIREVTIYDIKFERFMSPILLLKIRCSPGTYIRWIANEIGKKLGCGAFLLQLRRLSIGPFTLENSLTRRKLDMAENINILTPLEIIEKLYKVLDVDEEQARLVKNGTRIRFDDLPEEGIFGISHDNKLLAIAEAIGDSQYEFRRVL
ncbi:MAG: tRNA pseudouridine(55) synthase TruB [Candidatus Zixiibacteriota bacterium]